MSDAAAKTVTSAPRAKGAVKKRVTAAKSPKDNRRIRRSKQRDATNQPVLFLPRLRGRCCAQRDGEGTRAFPPSASCSLRLPSAPPPQAGEENGNISFGTLLHHVDLRLHGGMVAAVIFDLAGLLQHRFARLVRRQIDIEAAVARGGGVRDEVLVAPLDGVAHLRLDFTGRKSNALYLNFHHRCRSRTGCGKRGNENSGQQRDAAPHFSAAASMRACSSWPLKIFRPVCSRLFNSALLAEGIGGDSTGPFALW